MSKTIMSTGRRRVKIPKVLPAHSSQRFLYNIESEHKATSEGSYSQLGRIQSWLPELRTIVTSQYEVIQLP